MKEKIKKYPLAIYETSLSILGYSLTRNYDFILIGLPLAFLTFCLEKFFPYEKFKTGIKLS